MQKKVRRPVSTINEPSGKTPLISSESGPMAASGKNPVDAISGASSNDNSKPGAPVITGSGTNDSPRPKVYMSPKKAAAKSEATKKKSTRFSAIPIQSEEPPVEKVTTKISLPPEKPMPALSSKAPESSDELQPLDGSITADDFLGKTPGKSSGLFFDMKFAIGLIAIVVAVNLLLALLVDKSDPAAGTPQVATAVPAKPVPVAHAPTPVAPVVAPVAAAPKAEPMPQGAIVTNSLPDIQPSAGMQIQKPVAVVAAPVATPKQQQPNLGVVTTAADEKRAAQPARSMLSIIDQAN